MVSVRSFGYSSMVAGNKTGQVVFMYINLTDGPFSTGFGRVSRTGSFISSLLVVGTFDGPLPQAGRTAQSISRDFLVSSQGVDPDLCTLSTGYSSHAASDTMATATTTVKFPPGIRPYYPKQVASVASLRSGATRAKRTPPSGTFPGVEVSK